MIAVAVAVEINQEMAISVATMQKRVQSLIQGNQIEEIVKKIVLSDEQALKERKEWEFSRGLRPNNTKIGTYKDEEYADFKRQINPLGGGNVDLLLTRSFLNKMSVQVDVGREFIFNSSDSKRDSLLGKYGGDILKINQQWFEDRQTQIYKFRLVFDIKKILNA